MINDGTSGLCLSCNREIGIIEGVLKIHGPHTNALDRCHNSLTTRWVSATNRKARIGAEGIAPCGHSGEYVAPNFVICDRGCDGRTTMPDPNPFDDGGW